jgi:N-acetylneuraminic acid mutarotase
MRKIFTIAIIALSINAFAQTTCANDTFVSISNAPSSDAFKTVSFGSDIYVFGTQAGKYSTVNDSWTNIANLPTPRGEFGIAEVNGTIYCMGGYTGSLSNKNEAYNISTNSWTTKANLPVAIAGAFSVSLNNKIYIIGGGFGNTVSYFWEYNIQTDTYTTLTPPSQSRMHTSLITYNNKIYFVGGYYYNNGYNYTNQFDEYNPITDSWTSKPPLPASIFRTGTTVYDNKLFVFGGTSQALMTPLNSFYTYDFLNDTWTVMPNMPFSRASIEAQNLNGTIYLFGGHINSNSTTNLCYKYFCQYCTNVLISDTTTYHVSDLEFQNISPQINYYQTDSLTSALGGCDSVVNRFIKYIFDPSICSDTVLISVTDTLFINTTITGINPPNNNNTIKLFPNPTNDHITINYGNFSTMIGYQLRIENSLSQQVFQTNITQQSDYLNLTTWGGNGLYFVHIIDPQGNTIDIRKILLQ